MAESEEELKIFLMRVKEESENAGLKLSTQKTKIMAPGSIISWQIDGQTWKQGQTLFSWAPKSLQMVTTTMKLKTLAPWKESYNKSDSVLKSRDITLPTMVHTVKAMVFPVVMYRCELDHKKG